MPYIGVPAQSQFFAQDSDNFKVDNFAAGAGFTAGSSTTVTLTATPGTENALIVMMDGVTQHHNTFSVSGTTLTFDTAIPSGVSNIEVQYYIRSILSAPTDGSVVSSSLGSGAVTAGKIGTGGVSANTQLATGVVTAHATASDIAKTDVQQSFSVAQRGSISDQGVKAAGTVTLDLNTANYYSFTVNGNITLANPSNTTAGQAGALFMTANGSYTTSFGSHWRFPTGTAPTMSTSAGKVDRIDYVVQSANTIHAVASIDLLGTA